MKKIIFFISIIIVCCGCDKPQETSSQSLHKKLAPTHRDQEWLSENSKVHKENKKIDNPIPDNLLIYNERINKNLPVFKFKIIGKKKGYYFIPSYIEIINSANSKKIQKLKAKYRFDNWGEGWEVDYLPEHLLQFFDLNKDGFKDLRVFRNAGMTGNNWFATYLYNPAIKKFVFHVDISLMSGVQYDPVSQQIVTYNRGGYCEEFMEYYKLKGDKIFLQKIEWTEGGTDCYKITGRPIKKNIRIRRDIFFQCETDKFIKHLRKNMKVIGEEELEGSLDGRARGPLGNPID